MTLINWIKENWLNILVPVLILLIGIWLGSLILTDQSAQIAQWHIEHPNETLKYII